MSPRRLPSPTHRLMRKHFLRPRSDIAAAENPAIRTTAAGSVIQCNQIGPAGASDRLFERSAPPSPTELKPARIRAKAYPMTLRRSLCISLLVLASCTVGDRRSNDDSSGDKIPHSDDSDSTSASNSAQDSNSDSSSDSSASDTTDDFTIEPCNEVHVALEQEPARIMLVLDKSGSMRTLWDHDQDTDTSPVTRWSSLISVVDSLTTKFDETIEFGAQLFPSKSANGSLSPDACKVESTPEVSVAPNNREAILAGIPASSEMSTILGGTPTAVGMESALNHLATLEHPEYPTAIILVTDGAANCDQTAIDCVGDTSSSECKKAMFETYDPHLEPLVINAFNEDNIPTYVVGIDIVDELLTNPGNPPINPHDALNDLAEAGGTARANSDTKFFNAVNQDQLLDALQEIAGQIRTCTVDLTVPPNTPPDPAQAAFVKFELNGVEVKRLDDDADCKTESGWIWRSPNGPYSAVELCGEACDALKVEGKIDGEYGCLPPE